MDNTYSKTAVRKLMVFASRFFFASIVATLFSNVLLAADPQLSIENRLDRIERLVNNQNLLQMYTAQQSLKQEISALRGDFELLNHELQNIKKQQKDIYLDLDQRMQELEKNVTSLRSMPPVPVFPSAVTPSLGGEGVASEIEAPDSAEAASAAAGDAGTEAVQASLTEQESYQGALAVLKSGQYEEAIKGFQVFLVSYPASNYASNAQYWMAEAYYVLKDFTSAISHFNKVITAYPDSRKIADANLKIGFSYYELKDWSNARVALEKVLSDFPSSTAARLAERRLQKMKLEGNI